MLHCAMPCPVLASTYKTTTVPQAVLNRAICGTHQGCMGLVGGSMVIINLNTLSPLPPSPPSVLFHASSSPLPSSPLSSSAFALTCPPSLSAGPVRAEVQDSDGTSPYPPTQFPLSFYAIPGTSLSYPAAKNVPVLAVCTELRYAASRHGHSSFRLRVLHTPSLALSLARAPSWRHICDCGCWCVGLCGFAARTWLNAHETRRAQTYLRPT
eukprot:1694890-Rhodomonas_salina.1